MWCIAIFFSAGFSFKNNILISQGSFFDVYFCWRLQYIDAFSVVLAHKCIHTKCIEREFYAELKYEFFNDIVSDSIKWYHSVVEWFDISWTFIWFIKKTYVWPNIWRMLSVCSLNVFELKKNCIKLKQFF